MLVVQSTMPMQFGPSSAIPWRIAMSRTVALHLGGRLAALDHAAARDRRGGTPGVGRLLGEAGRPQRVDGEDDRVRALGQGRRGVG